MEFRFKPSDKVCSQEMIIELEGDIEKLKGIPCGYRGTSCPDQLAIALEEAKSKLLGGK